MKLIPGLCPDLREAREPSLDCPRLQATELSCSLMEATTRSKAPLEEQKK